MVLFRTRINLVPVKRITYVPPVVSSYFGRLLGVLTKGLDPLKEGTVVKRTFQNSYSVCQIQRERDKKITFSSYSFLSFTSYTNQRFDLFTGYQLVLIYIFVSTGAQVHSARMLPCRRLRSSTRTGEESSD